MIIWYQTSQAKNVKQSLVLYKMFCKCLTEARKRDLVFIFYLWERGQSLVSSFMIIVDLNKCWRIWNNIEHNICKCMWCIFYFVTFQKFIKDSTLLETQTFVPLPAYSSLTFKFILFIKVSSMYSTQLKHAH